MAVIRKGKDAMLQLSGNCLFQYNRTATRNDGSKVANANFINPLQVISFFWEENQEGYNRLNVFLTNKTLVFSEEIGKNFVNHMENFLRFMCAPPPSAGPVETVQRQQRRSRPSVEAEIITDDILQNPGEATFV